MMAVSNVNANSSSVRTRHRKASYDSFKIYVMRLLRKIKVDDVGVSSLALQVLDGLAMHFIRGAGMELHRLRRYTKKKTVDAAEMRTAMRLMARHSELRYFLVESGERAVRAYADKHGGASAAGEEKHARKRPAAAAATSATT